MNRPRVAILSIGNEVLRGDVDNSNSHWLSQRFTERGAFVVHVAVVRDEIEHLRSEFDQAVRYAPKLIVTTGGLGPTADDLTLRAIAEATGLPLEEDPRALRMIEERYADLAREGRVPSAAITPSRLKMALLPKGSIALANRVGTAPGVALDRGDCTVVCLPGVPAEMTHIFATSLEPVLARTIGSGVQRERVAYAVTSDESLLSAALASTQDRHPEVYVKSHAAGFQREGRFRITVSTLAGTEAEAIRSLNSALIDLEASLARDGLRLEGSETALTR